jgi:mannose-1-phosphate guanylyltransferase/mannose-6-phosphate isomerase
MTAAAVWPVLLAGGSGTRLWPLSRAEYPKQFWPLVSTRSLLQETALRFAAEGFGAPLVIANETHRFLVAEQLRAVGIAPRRLILEPVPRNTAPAAALAALLAAREAPETILLLAPTDHVVRDSAALGKAIAAARPLAEAGHLVTFGIAPRAAETGYGYIRAGEPLGPGAYHVADFIEKPDAARAARLLAAGGYSWNSGLFLCAAGSLLAELERLEPALLAGCRAALAGATADLDFLRLERAPFEAIAPRSLDHAVMERTGRAAVVPVEIGWSDVGSWPALHEITPKDRAGNVALGAVVLEGCRNSYVRSEAPLVIALGLDDLVVVAAGDAVLVAKADASAGVRGVVERLAGSGHPAARGHPTVHRPWGSYELIKAGPRYKVKLLRVKPGAALSLQYHNRRAEHWVVVGGAALIERGGATVSLAPDQSLYVPLGVAHRLANPGATALEVIEVQTGDYLEEDDIVRLDDRYGRGEPT